jgi:EAL domain-containing protein (putative c-di-GMP-specific phosphodiesterase class I)
MFVFTVCLLVGITAVILRLLLSLRWKRKHCPKCGYSLQRIKRRISDRLLGRLLVLPVSRCQCNHIQCRWTGRTLHALKSVLHETKPPALKELKAQQPQSPSPLKTKDTSEFDSLFKLEKELNQSLARDEFLLHYQPRIDLKTNNITGMEALLRWQHPENGFIDPSVFISLADQNALIFPIGRWVLKTVCFQIQAWHSAGLYPLSISINLSARQFYQPNLIRTIQKVLTQTGLDPQFLEIEVTEATILQNFYEATKVLRALRLLRVKTAVDNFGLGDSTLEQLQQISLDILKIDQSLICNLDVGSNGVEKIQGIIDLAQVLDLSVTAKGVETREQLKLLRSLGCPTVQGYLFDPPLATEDATDVLQSNWIGRQDKTTSASAMAL